MADNKLGRARRLMDDWGLRLFADPLPGSDKQPFMFFDFRYEENGKVAVPHIGVNLRKEGKDNRLDFYCDPSTIQVITDTIMEMTTPGSTLDFRRIDLMTGWKFGKKLDKKEVDVGWVAARDSEGVFFGLAQQGRDNVKFYFRAPRDVVLRDKSGAVVSNLETSILFARAQIKHLERNFNQAMDAGYMERDEIKIAGENKRKQAFSGRNGGNQNGGGQNQGSASTPSAGAEAPMDFDTDIPF